MPMTVVVTRNVPGRFRGFLASCMCEVAPGVYTAPRMAAGVRERVWSVLESWWAAYPDSALVMTWPDRTMPGGQNLRTLGAPTTELREHHGVFLARRDRDVDEEEVLSSESEGVVGRGSKEPRVGETDGEGIEASSRAPAKEAGGGALRTAGHATGPGGRNEASDQVSDAVTETREEP